MTWTACLDEANAAVSQLLHKLKALSSSGNAQSARRAATATAAGMAPLLELTQAVITAISGLRKVLQAKALAVANNAAAGVQGMHQATADIS